LIGGFERIISIEKIVAVVLYADHVPEASGGETVEWIHFILEPNLIALNFFQVINDPNIGLDLVIFFRDNGSFSLSGWFFHALLL
jgi:hypothetical protein